LMLKRMTSPARIVRGICHVDAAAAAKGL
jgi:hypothetical protein